MGYNEGEKVFLSIKDGSINWIKSRAQYALGTAGWGHCLGLAKSNN